MQSWSERRLMPSRSNCSSRLTSWWSFGRAGQGARPRGCRHSIGGKGGGKARPVRTCAGGAILEHAVAAELGESIAPKVELLVLGRDPSVADQHPVSGRAVGEAVRRFVSEVIRDSGIGTLVLQRSPARISRQLAMFVRGCLYLVANPGLWNGFQGGSWNLSFPKVDFSGLLKSSSTVGRSRDQAGGFARRQTVGLQ
jgi:hypothetical protein